MKNSLAVAGLSAAAMLLLSACASETPTGATGAVTESSAVSTPPATGPAVASEVILNGTDAPEGFLYHDVAAILAESEASEDGEEVLEVLRSLAGNAVSEPEHCGPLVPSAVDALVNLDDDREGSAGSEFTAPDGNVISVFATTGESFPRAPEDLSQCTTFSRTVSFSDSRQTVNHRVEPLDIGGGPVGSLRAARILSDQDIPGADTTVVSGEADGVYFLFSAPLEVEQQLVVDLAQAQVEKITGRS